LCSGAWGSIEQNSQQGIYGSLFVGKAAENALEAAFREEVRVGPAQILADPDGDGAECYSAEIERINPESSAENRNFIICVTDERLLALTGGIVQGMSGSPIIQDGKLVGAVTHVLVNDPTRGYGIFIENMLDAAG
jgi:stage IV sporulation protein B